MCSITAPLLQMLSSSTGTPALRIDHQGVSVGAAHLDVRGALGLTLGGPLETAQIVSVPGDNLQLLSPSGEMTLIGSQGVRIHDGTGFNGIELTSNDDISITSRSGAVSLVLYCYITAIITKTYTGATIHNYINTLLTPCTTAGVLRRSKH